MYQSDATNRAPSAREAAERLTHRPLLTTLEQKVEPRHAAVTDIRRRAAAATREGAVAPGKAEDAVTASAGLAG